jgi:hypothetical protein
VTESHSGSSESNYVNEKDFDEEETEEEDDNSDDDRGISGDGEADEKEAIQPRPSIWERETESYKRREAIRSLPVSSIQLSEIQIKEIIKKVKKEMKLTILLKEIDEKEAMKLLFKRFQIPKSILYLISLKKEEIPREGEAVEAGTGQKKQKKKKQKI